MVKKLSENASEELREAMMRLNGKLDQQFNGDVVNDTFVKHIKKAVEKVVENRRMMDDIVKAGIPKDASEWMLYLFAVMQAGPLPEECKNVDFKKGMDEFVKKYDLARKFEESKG